MKFAVFAIVFVLSIFASITPAKEDPVLEQHVEPPKPLKEKAVSVTVQDPETRIQPTEPPKEELEKPKVEPVVGDCATEVHKYDWHIPTALAIMHQESSNNPQAFNGDSSTGDYSWGCFQINLYGANAYTRPSAEWLSVASNNVQYAYSMYKSMGTFCSTGGWYNTCKKLNLQ